MEPLPEHDPKNADAMLHTERLARREHLLREANSKFWFLRELPWMVPGILIYCSGMWLLFRVYEARERGRMIETSTPMELVMAGAVIAGGMLVVRLKMQIQALVRFIEEEQPDHH